LPGAAVGRNCWTADASSRKFRSRASQCSSPKGGLGQAHYAQTFVAAWTDLIAAIKRAVGIVTVGRIAVAAETVAKFAMLMASMETAEVPGHVAATEAAAKMTAAETATMAPTTATASECGS
jgi:hypothetical protein